MITRRSLAVRRLPYSIKHDIAEFNQARQRCNGSTRRSLITCTFCYRQQSRLQIFIVIDYSLKWTSAKKRRFAIEPNSLFTNGSTRLLCTMIYQWFTNGSTRLLWTSLTALGNMASQKGSDVVVLEVEIWIRSYRKHFLLYFWLWLPRCPSRKELLRVTMSDPRAGRGRRVTPARGGGFKQSLPQHLEFLDSICIHFKLKIWVCPFFFPGFWIQGRHHHFF